MSRDLRRIAWLAIVGTIAATGSDGAWAAPGASLDPRALSLLHAMSDFLGSQGQLTVRADSAIEAVRESGQKIEVEQSSQIWLKRPHGLRSDRRGSEGAAEFYYDGTTFTLSESATRYYAVAPAPASMDQAIDAARDRLGLETAAGDLLYTKPYNVLTEDLVSAAYVGPEDVRGVLCQHLAFRGTETDWQIWIEDGKDAVPRKLVVTSKKLKSAPEFRAELSQWNFAPEIADAIFEFRPPVDARRIEFRGVHSIQMEPIAKGGAR